MLKRYSVEVKSAAMDSVMSTQTWGVVSYPNFRFRCQSAQSAFIKIIDFDNLSQVLSG